MDNLHDALRPFKDNPNETAIFSDLDGTLSTIAPTPGEARISGGMRETLQALAQTYRVVAVISGRDSNDAKRIVGVENILYVGNHGLEWMEDGAQHYVPSADRFSSIAPRLAEALSERLAGMDILIEKKKLGVALHYRRANDKVAAQRAIERAIQPALDTYGLKQAEGRYVIELKPDLPGNKGIAVAEIAAQKRVKNALYLGDDVTDIDAFKALEELRRTGVLRVVTVAVASREAPPEVAEAADFVIASVGEVEELLRWLAA